METYKVFYHTPVAIANNWQRPRTFHAPTWEQARDLITPGALPGYNITVEYYNIGKIFDVWYNKEE